MAWKLTKLANGWEPLPGVPWRDMEDDEFRRIAREYTEFNQFPAKALENSGFFEHVEDKPSSEKKED